MIAIAITALFSIITMMVSLVLIDSIMKFYNAAVAIKRSAQADRLANVPEDVAAKSIGVVTAVQVNSIAPSAAARRPVKLRTASRFKAPAARYAA